MTATRSGLRICVLLTVLGTGCDTNSNSGSPQKFLPFELGNRWVMQVRDTLRVYPADPDRFVASERLDTLQIVRDSVVNGERWFQFKSHDEGMITPGRHSSAWYTVREDGLWNQRYRRGDFLDPVHVIRFPAAVDEPYRLEPAKIDYALVSSDATYEVPDIGAVPTVRFRQTYPPGFNLYRGHPNPTVSGMDTFSFSDSITVMHDFSPEFGLVRIEGIIILVDRDEQRLIPVGSFRWTLKEFIPANLP